MNTIKNALWNIRIGRKWEKLNRSLYMEDVNEFNRAITMARKASKMDQEALRAYNKALIKAARAM